MGDWAANIDTDKAGKVLCDMTKEFEHYLIDVEKLLEGIFLLEDPYLEEWYDWICVLDR